MYCDNVRCWRSECSQQYEAFLGSNHTSSVWRKDRPNALYLPFAVPFDGMPLLRTRTRYCWEVGALGRQQRSRKCHTRPRRSPVHQLFLPAQLLLLLVQQTRIMSKIPWCHGVRPIQPYERERSERGCRQLMVPGKDQHFSSDFQGEVALSHTRLGVLMAPSEIIVESRHVDGCEHGATIQDE